ncbi:hypothetical protein AK812_SmicGene17028 [Symbiodinium microadriaticum]|uniref:Uncharacterized protein n=1 Tax=Symbiodinium microadriaticum TaxID=2951 RepID=A0A1Q9DYT3_SYMMI|nr:hypothetical protein AK812_SmicGene17028 [Symbiodinium microadriaticum]
MPSQDKTAVPVALAGKVLCSGYLNVERKGQVKTPFFVLRENSLERYDTASDFEKGQVEFIFHRFIHVHSVVALADHCLLDVTLVERWTSSPGTSPAFIMELLAFVVLACHPGPHWMGDLILYVTDNANVRSWLRKRRPGNRIASLLVRLVRRLEAEQIYTVHPICTLTHRDQLADWLSREDLGVVRAQLLAEGWEESTTEMYWEQFLQDARRSALVYDTHSQDQLEVTSCVIALKLFKAWEPGKRPRVATSYSAGRKEEAVLSKLADFSRKSYNA